MDADIIAKATKLRHELHAHPELSYDEVWTRARLMEFVRENTQLELHDMGRWFYATYRSGKDLPGIAFRADFDALPVPDEIDAPYRSTIPGCGHKCGHDGHAATLAGFAMMLARYGAPRDVYLLFQHAEETGQGAVECTSLLTNNDISEIYAFHNSPGYVDGTVVTINGPMFCASTGFIISYKGKKSHASLPEAGRNPVFAIARIVNSLESLMDARAQGWKGMVLATVIAVNVGERAFGTSAGEGELLLTVRGEYEDEMNALIDRLKALALGEAAAYGLECSFAYEDTFPDTVNAPEAADKVRRAARELNYDIFEMPEPDRSSEDFGYLTKLVPGCIFYIGAGLDAPTTHTVGFDFPDRQIPQALSIFEKLVAMEPLVK